MNPNLTYECLNESQTVLTLHRQIEALSPLRISYHSLQNYHKKVTSDLQSLVEEHDSAISSLRANVKGLNDEQAICESVRNDALTDLKEQQSEQARLASGLRNLGQQYESLAHKIDLELNRKEQSLSYRKELENIKSTIGIHTDKIKEENQKLLAAQSNLSKQFEERSAQITERKVLNEEMSNKNDSIKQKAAQLNIKNEDIADCNLKFERELCQKEGELSSANRINRNLKEGLFELKSQYEAIQSQINYKINLMSSERHTQKELQSRQQSAEKALEFSANQLSHVNQENQQLQRDISSFQKTRQESVLFKSNSQSHLEELRRANEVLLSQMEELCIRDRDIETLLMRKVQSLEYFSKRLSFNYESECFRAQSSISPELVFRRRAENVEKTTNLQEKESSSLFGKAISRQQSEKTQCSRGQKENAQ